MHDDFQPVWAALSDDALEKRLRRYYWLTTAAPNIYLVRFLGLVEEVKRRGKPEILTKVEHWVERYGGPPPL
jgi:hypothetical protein